MPTLMPTMYTASWDVETGLRQRARRALVLASETDQAIKAMDTSRGSQARSDPQFMPALTSLLNDFHLFTDAAVVLAAMSIEGFLNFYGTVRFGEEFFKTNFERLSPHQKLPAIVAGCS